MGEGPGIGLQLKHMWEMTVPHPKETMPPSPMEWRFANRASGKLGTSC